MSTKKKRHIDITSALFLTAMLIIFLSASAIAPVETTTVTFSIPSSIGHSLGYAGTCDDANFAFVEDDGSLDGTQDRINVTTTDNQVCQTDAVAAMTITNNGNTNVTIEANFTAALPVNVTVKASLAEAGFEASCTGPPPSTTTCVEFDNSDGATAKAVTLNITASGSDDVWWWANFTNFNEGMSTTTTRTLQTNSILA